MSWSITFIGKPENIAVALDERGTKMEGQSKIEFDDAVPHLKALVMQNFGNSNQILRLVAGGSGYAADGEQKQRSFYASIESFHGQAV